MREDTIEYRGVSVSVIEKIKLLVSSQYFVFRLAFSLGSGDDNDVHKTLKFSVQFRDFKIGST